RERMHPFDLSNGPLLRARLLRKSAEDHILLLTIHRLAGEERSLQIIFEDLAELYFKEVHEDSNPSSQIGVNWRQFLATQVCNQQTESFRKELEYWKEKLAGDLPVLD